jgi:hypothetical protein
MSITTAVIGNQLEWTFTVHNESDTPTDPTSLSLTVSNRSHVELVTLNKSDMVHSGTGIYKAYWTPPRDTKGVLHWYVASTSPDAAAKGDMYIEGTGL